MVGLIELLNAARDAGLTWGRDDERLLVRGPRAAGELAKQLVARKMEVFATLNSPPPNASFEVAYDPLPDWAIESALAAFPIDSPPPTMPSCFCCGECRWWRSTFGPHLICEVCHPPSFSSVIAERIHQSA